MKNFSLLFVLSFITSATFSQTLFTYGTQQVSKDEFLKAFNKNNTSPVNKDSALREYLDLYINFKIKVKAAHDLHLNKLPEINTELQNFRTQIEEAYLTDDKQIDVLVEEAFSRSQKDIHIIHLFIPVDKNATTDTIKIYKSAQEAYNELTKTGSFENAVRNLKEKAINASWGDAGFITVFTLPYEFENLIYNLKPGQISELYRSKNGYHIFKNIEERKAAGKIKVAQILIAVPPGADAKQKDNAGKLADSVYKVLLNDADFSEIAKSVSDDKNTSDNGGVLPEFSTGSYDPVFEKNAFALQKDGDISVPFQTSFGFHILKRLGSTPIPAQKNNVEYMASLKQRVQQDARIATAKEKLLKDVLKKLGFKKNAGINENALWRITDSFTISNKKFALPGIAEKTTLYSFGSNKVTVADWLKFAKDYKSSSSYKGESNQELMKSYISTTAFNNYRKNLENFNPDFKHQLQEFKDGNVLFEIMERNVWSKASADSTGIIKFFEENKTKYYWKESADVILISCTNLQVAKQAAEQLRSGKTWQQIAEENITQVQADSGRYELYQLPVKLSSNLSEQTITEPVVNEADNTASFVKIIKVYPAHQPRTFEEARGLVINDYQNLLEENWIQQLKKKYPVKINQKVFQSLLN
jgi:peptidyl-prolyl cis-trans isomerase SurA